MGKLPASQFYWGDWRRDPGIRACTFETRGIWFEMLCIMHECENRGFFMLNGLPLDDSMASRVIGCSPEQYKNAIAELESNNVMSRNCHTCKMYHSGAKICDMSQSVTPQSQDCHGIIFNRRMVKEDKQRQGYKERKRKSRLISHGKVTPTSPNSPVVSSSSSSINNNKENHKTLVTPMSQPPNSIKKWYKNEQGNYVCYQCQKSYMQYQKLQDHFVTHKKED